MIHLEGDKTFPLPIADVSAKLSDAGFLVNCLPDSKVAVATPDKAVWSLRPKLAFMTGALDATMESTGRDAGAGAAFKIVTKAIGAGSTVNVRLAFAAAGTETAVHWTGDVVEVTGLLKMVPKGLLQATAQKVIEDVWVAVAAKLTAAV